MLIYIIINMNNYDNDNRHYYALTTYLSIVIKY